MELKKVIAIVIAVVAAYMVFKMLFWLLANVFAIMWFGFKVIIVFIIAIPIYLIVKNWLMRR